MLSGLAGFIQVDSWQEGQHHEYLVHVNIWVRLDAVL